MLPLLMLVDVSALKPYWRKWDTQTAELLVLGALPGAALGAALYSVAEPDLFRILIGAISIGFVVWQISAKCGWIRTSERPLPP